MLSYITKKRAGKIMSKERRNQISKKQKVKKLMPFLAALAVVIIITAAVSATFINKCDDCSTVIWGKGYYKENGSQGVLSSVFGTFFGDTESIPIETVDGVIICRECAMNNTSVKSELRDVSEFKR